MYEIKTSISALNKFLWYLINLHCTSTLSSRELAADAVGLLGRFQPIAVPADFFIERQRERNSAQRGAEKIFPPLLQKGKYDYYKRGNEKTFKVFQNISSRLHKSILPVHNILVHWAGQILKLCPFKHIDLVLAN